MTWDTTRPTREFNPKIPILTDPEIPPANLEIESRVLAANLKIFRIIKKC